MSPSAYRRACACLLALLVTPTAGFASAFAATGAAASSSAGKAAPHAVDAKRHKKKKRKKDSKKTAACSKRTRKAKARKSDVTVPVPGVTTVTVPLPGGSTTTTTTTVTVPAGGTTTTTGSTTTTTSKPVTTTTTKTSTTTKTVTSTKPGTTTTGSKPGTTTTGSSKPAATNGSTPSSSGATTPSTTTKSKKKSRKHSKKKRHHKKHRKHASKKKTTKKKAAKRHATKKKTTHKKHAAKKHSTKKKTTHKKHSTKKKKSSKKKRKSTTQTPTQQAPTQQCTPAPAPTSPPAPTGFTVGMVSGPAAAWEAGMTNNANLHPKVVRVPLDIGASVSTVQNQVAGLAAKGEQAMLMAEFYGTIPSTSQAQNLANWAKAFGPGGTFWQGRSDGNLAVRDIEFGNETNESYQFGGVSSGPSYISRAQNYALRAKDAIDAINAANPNVGLIVQADNGGCGCSQWVDGMFSAVPDLNKRVAGWVAHPYGPKSRYGPIMNQMQSDLAKHGDTTKPFFITEYGISTNNGACLDSNYSWPTCLTYQQAADDMHAAIQDLHQTYPRLAQMFIFEQRDMANNPNGREANFGAIKTDGSPKGAFTDEIRWETSTYRG
jgi:hypothetical protein